MADLLGELRFRAEEHRLDGRSATAHCMSSAADEIERLTRELAELKAQKWDVKHADTANDFALLGMARDDWQARATAAEAREAAAMKALRTCAAYIRSPLRMSRDEDEAARRKVILDEADAALAKEDGIRG